MTPHSHITIHKLYHNSANVSGAFVKQQKTVSSYLLWVYLLNGHISIHIINYFLFQNRPYAYSSAARIWHTKGGVVLPWNIWYKSDLSISRRCHLWSLRCSWSIACRRYSNLIFILDITPGFNWLAKMYCKNRRETFKFWIWCDLY